MGVKDVVCLLQAFLVEELREQEQTIWPERRDPERESALAWTCMEPCALRELEIWPVRSRCTMAR